MSNIHHLPRRGGTHATDGFAPTDTFIREPEPGRRAAFLPPGESRRRLREHYDPSRQPRDWPGIIIAAVVIGAFAAMLIVGLHMTPGKVLP